MFPRGRPQDDIAASAAEWVIRMGGAPLRDDERRRLDGWLAESPVHQAAFDHAQTTWMELAALKTVADPVPGGSSPPRRDRLLPAFRSKRSAVTVLWRVAAFCVVLLVGSASAIFWFGDPLLLLTADYRTAPGESRSVTLADGTRVDLNTDSALAVRFDDRERRIALLAGEAYFTVVPEARPFLVEAANGTARALGTEFAIDRMGDSTSVTVAQHQVRVSVARPDGSEANSVVLSPGQSVDYDRGARMGPVNKVKADLTTSWRQGYLVFNEARLADVVAALNRYRRGRIVITNDSLAERRVSGVFNVGDLSEGLTVIARELGAGTASLPPFVTLLY